jgi:CheY-like chemotaxis protein/two-component sensor histidine kinase
MTETIESLRQRCERAEQAVAAKAVFLATMSHEIREPMNGVLGMTRLLLETPLSSEQRSFVEAVLDSGEALLTIINDILDLSRMEAGRLDLEAIDFDPRSLVERTTTLLRQRAEDKGLTLEVEIDPALPRMLRGDPGRLRQILINLLGNAIKFTSEGTVALRLCLGERADARCRVGFVVSDTGIGIPEHALGNLFAPYTQADPSVPRLFGGSGLGLTICHRLVALMGGSIRAASAPGDGTTFRFDVALDAVAEHPAPLPGHDVAGMAVLVVDPTPATREMVQQQLRSWRIDVEEATSGGEALRILHEARARPFDVVLVDSYLTDMSGEELGRRIRFDPALAAISLVMLASSGLRGDAARVEAIGFAAYLQKPLTASTLLDCLAELRSPSAAPDHHRGGLITVHSISERRRPGLHILVADDNPVNSRLAGLMLAKGGHEVDVVADGAAAVAALGERAYDLVLMDVQMPGIDGLEATRRIRALVGDRASVPIVAVTANAMNGDERRCLDAGMDDYVTKPIDRARLLDTVSRWGYRQSA